MLETLKDSAAILFGGGGLIGIVLAILKFRRDGQKRSSPSDGTTTVQIQANKVDGDVVGRDKTTTTGIGALELGIILSAIVAIVGLFLLLMPAPVTHNTATASGNGVAVSGNESHVSVDKAAD